MKGLTTMMAMARRGGAATLGCWTLSAAPFASALAFSVVKVPRRFLGSSSKSAIPKVKACGDLSTYDLVCGQEAKLWVGRDHGVARIELDRMQSRNALGHNMLTDLEHCVVKASELTIDHTIRCVVVHSCTESVFCAGADLKERRAMGEDEVVAFVKRLRASFLALQRLPVPTIAAVGGVALGGGFELALSCDLRVGSDGCVLGLPETRLAIIPGAGGTQRLPHLIGVPKAKDLIYTGRTLKAYEAYEFGCLDRYVVQGGALEEALSLANTIAGGGPVALQAAKEAVDGGFAAATWEGKMAVEEECYARVVPTEDRLEALAAFSEKRKPNFKGA